MLTLRDYQIECLQAINKHFETENTQLIQMPTGSGKTIVFWHYLLSKKGKSIIICPTRDLVLQTYEKGRLILGTLFDKLTTLYPKTSTKIKPADHYIVTAASLWRDNTLNFFLEQKIDTIILDECHHSCSKTYQHFINKLLDKNPKLKVIGFTATPERLDKGDLLTTFGKITFRRNVLDLIEKGHLCDVCAYRIKTGQRFSDKVISGDDFSQIALKELDNDSRNKLIIKTYKDNCKGKKTLIFCINVDHAERLAQAMKEKGIKVSSISARKTDKQRKSVIESFRNGEIDVLTNCQLLTEGFDEPSIEALIIARPTKSKVLYCQMVGRGLRNHPGKDLCYLYELTDNSHKICTFDVLAYEKKPPVEYTSGTKLTNLVEDVEKLSLEIIELKKESLDLFNKKKDKFAGLVYVYDALTYLRKSTNVHTYDVDQTRRLLKGLCDFKLLDMKKENLEQFRECFLKNLAKDSKNKPRSDAGKHHLVTYLYKVASSFEDLIEDGLDVYNVFMFICLQEFRNIIDSHCRNYFDPDLYLKYDGKIPAILKQSHFDIFEASKIFYKKTPNFIEKTLKKLEITYAFTHVYKNDLLKVFMHLNPTMDIKECKALLNSLILENLGNNNVQTLPSN